MAIIDGGDDLIIKIADTIPGKRAIQCESKALRALRDTDHNFLHPELILEDEWAGYLIQVQTNLPKTRPTQAQKLCVQHIQTLTDLSQLNQSDTVFCESSCYAEIEKLASKQKATLPASVAEILKQIMNPEFQKKSILCHRIHGDFTPWNMNVGKANITLWDWEDSVEDGLVFFDIFHFVIRQSILVGPWPGVSKLLQIIKENCARLQIEADFPVDTNYLISLKIWLILEYLRNPHKHIIEFATHMENLNG